MKTLVKWSVQDYHRMIEAGILSDRRVELLEGEIVAMSPEGPLHASNIRKVANYLRQLLEGLALVSEAHPITLSDSEPEPDLAIVRLPESRYTNHHPTIEDIFWVIEIADSSIEKDLREKKYLYAKELIPEYWVIDINQQILTVFRQPQLNDYTVKQEINQGEINPLAFPDIRVLIKNILP